MNKKILSTITILLCVVGVTWVTYYRNTPHMMSSAKTASESTQIQIPHTVTYLCDADHTVVAMFSEHASAEVRATATDTPPVPTGLVSVVLDNEPSILLLQTISADGARYANFDESLVFWSKGQSAIVLLSGEEKMYTHCREVADDTSKLVPQVYHDDTYGFVVRLPSDYKVTKQYTYTALQRPIAGVKFTVPQSITKGTNLSPDSYVSIERADVVGETCTAATFMDLKYTGGKVSEITSSDLTYSTASSSDAAAGNRYQEFVFVRPGLQECTAVRYFIHSTAIENYDPGTIVAFDTQKIFAQFDAIRDSLVTE